MKFLEKVFSIKNKGCHKVIIISGLKIKFRNKFKILEQKISDLQKENKEIKEICVALQNENLEFIKKNSNFQKELSSVQLALKSIGDKQEGLCEEKDELQTKLQTQECKVSNLFKTVGILNREKNLTNWRFNYLIDQLGQEDLKDMVLQQRFFYSDNEYELNTENPKTLNEKIYWLRKNYLLDNPLTDMVSDKLQFKSYITEKLGAEYIIPLLGKWENPRDIDWDALPDKFVLKSNWGGDGQQVFLVKDKSQLDIPTIVKKLREWIAPWGGPYYYAYTPIFKNIIPCIIAEEYMPIREGKALEYKMFCLNGKLEFCLIELDYFGHTPKRAYYDKNFKEVPYFIGNLPKVSLQEKPDTYDEMVRIAEKLAEPFPFVRVDFYDIDGKLYVGELTFTSGGGFSKYNPVEWDYELGEKLDISYLMEKNNA